MDSRNSVIANAVVQGRIGSGRSPASTVDSRCRGLARLRLARRSASITLGSGAGGAGESCEDLPSILFSSVRAVAGALMYQSIENRSSDDEWCGCAGGCGHDCGDVRHAALIVALLSVVFCTWCLVVGVWWLF